MKKIVLILSMFFASVSLVNATNVEPNTKKQDEPVKKEKVERVEPAACWVLADAIEAQHCGYVGCDFDLWQDRYDTCMSLVE